MPGRRRDERARQPDEGIRQIADGIDQYQGLRTPPVFWPMILFMQAAAYVDAGMPGPGFALIDEATQIGGADAMIAPLFHIVRGDLSMLGPEPDAAAATASYERAFAVAAGYGARMPAAPGGRPARPDCRRAGPCRPARDAPRVHATFTEGQSTPDLVEAAELLA